MSGKGRGAEAVLSAVCEAFQATNQMPMAGGGSGAHVVRLFQRDGSSVVAKYQARGTALVDGHGPEALRQKVLQTRLIREQLPALLPYCADVIAEFERQDAYGFVMPYYPGQTLTERMLSGESDGRQELQTVVETLIERGFSRCAFESRPGNFVQSHVHRVLRRLDLVMSNLPLAIASAERLNINGIETGHARELLERLMSRRQLLARLEPQQLSLPVHGDAVLSNFIWRDQERGAPEFVAIDPRGELAPMDPTYDFAKMFFSLSIYDLAMAAGFSVRVLQRGRCLRVQLNLRRELASYCHAARGFFDLLEGIRALAQMAPGGAASWRERTLYATAMHCLAFAACTLATRPERDVVNGSSARSAKRQAMLGFYLAGLASLAALLEGEETGRRLETGAYLRVLWRAGAEPPPEIAQPLEQGGPVARSPGAAG
ncbi:MAG TPA: phosphotransferase [Polyangiaceae bacterium]|jgi:aminoglycoside phosphotransferase (APT) family kinase protein|nr:phosphotransferase [Polyangiaceae bacterium]